MNQNLIVAPQVHRAIRGRACRASAIARGGLNRCPKVIHGFALLQFVGHGLSRFLLSRFYQEEADKLPPHGPRIK